MSDDDANAKVACGQAEMRLMMAGIQERLRGDTDIARMYASIETLQTEGKVTPAQMQAVAQTPDGLATLQPLLDAGYTKAGIVELQQRGMHIATVYQTEMKRVVEQIQAFILR